MRQVRTSNKKVAGFLPEFYTGGRSKIFWNNTSKLFMTMKKFMTRIQRKIITDASDTMINHLPKLNQLFTRFSPFPIHV